jgi:uncharacterized membrane protein
MDAHSQKERYSQTAWHSELVLLVDWLLLWFVVVVVVVVVQYYCLFGWLVVCRFIYGRGDRRNLPRLNFEI